MPTTWENVGNLYGLTFAQVVMVSDHVCVRQRRVETRSRAGALSGVVGVLWRIMDIAQYIE